MTEWKLGRRKLEVHHEEKTFYPKAKITKGDILVYYRKVADTMLTHLKDRPLSMHRYPDGIQGKDFFQKQIPDYFPKWIDRVSLKNVGKGKTTYVICNHAAALVYLADQACLTPHIFLSLKDRPRRPDRMIFDLDPADTSFAPVKEAARGLRDLLSDLGLKSYVMTTGSRGLHVVVPLMRKYDYDRVRRFAKSVAEMIAKGHPKKFTVEARKNKRKGRLYLDVMRNAYGQTSVAPYALRARPGAPVATPLEWEELAQGKLNARSYHLKNIFRRLGSKQDPWKDIGRDGQSLGKAERKLSQKSKRKQ